MTLLLERVGCALNISSTVMGLTLGAIGTSFPNLYASILTARAGQGDQAICQVRRALAELKMLSKLKSLCSFSIFYLAYIGLSTVSK